MQRRQLAFLRLHPLPNVIDVTGRQLAVVWCVGFHVAFDGRHEFPHAGLLDLGHRPADSRTRSVDGGKPQLAVWQVVYGASAST